MEKLIKTENPKIVSAYTFGDWKITIAEEKGFSSDNPIYSFYLTGLSITTYMFGAEKKMMEGLGHTFESLIALNLESYISSFIEDYDECNELINPFKN